MPISDRHLSVHESCPAPAVQPTTKGIARPAQAEEEAPWSPELHARLLTMNDACIGVRPRRGYSPDLGQTEAGQ